MEFRFADPGRPGLAGLLLTCITLSLAPCALAENTALNLVCSGNSYKADGPFPTPETFSLVINGTKSVMIGAPGPAKPVPAPVIANNAIQLKFKTGDFTGEYFHFTGDLFLIHSDGRLIRLTCQPA
jgi:hypothetical protein